jgi:4-hydroxy-2-oxoheptanedioate aldolase
MIPSFVRNKIARGEIVTTAKACYQDPELVELMASAGFDAIWLCLEHRRLDPATIYSLVQACRLGNADALVRIRPSNYTDVLWLLEAGVRGIMLPRVRHPDEVRALLAAVKFPPQGNRGCDLVHADSHFGRAPTNEYFAMSNRENFVVVQIEEPEVVSHIDAIAAMPGVDILFVGPGDLTLGLGKFGQTDDPQVVEIVREVAAACARHGKIAAIPCGAGQVKTYYDLGYRFFNLISDYRCVVNGIRQARADFAALALDGAKG